MNVKKIFSIILFLSLVSCDQVSNLIQPSPEAVLNEYLTALYKKDFATAYTKLSSVDTNYKSLAQYQSSYSSESSLGDMFLANSRFKIQSVSIIGNNAKAVVQQTVPDMGVMMSDLLGAAFTSAFNKNSDTNKAIEKAMKEKYSDGKLPLKTTTEEYRLLKEDSGWRVFVDFKGVDEQIAKEKEEEALKTARDEKIKSLLTEAKELQKNKNYVRAVEVYNDVLKEDTDNTTAENALKETEEEIETQKIKQEYITKVKIYDFEAKRIDTFLDKNLPAVRFSIKNEGDKTLNEVEVTVYFKDVNGKTIYEEDYYPVNVNRISFSGDDKPLKPNYVKIQKKGSFYTVENLGNEWKTGSATAVVTDIKFAPE